MSLRKSNRRKARGFTLVEMSVVVVIVAVLSAIGTVGFLRYRRAMRMAEAKDMVASIKSEQEAYKAEQGTYAAISQSVESYYPSKNPGKFATQWGGDCENCINNDKQGWRKIGVKPSHPVVYGYATVAGIGEEMKKAEKPSADPGGGATAAFTGGGAPPTDDDDSTDNACATIAPTQPFFIIKAKGDTDGDGNAAYVLALSCSNQLILTNEGE